MADRYWVGGAGYWNSTNTTNWSTTSGGSGGASVPTSLDKVFIDTGSGNISIGTSGGATYNAVCFAFSISNGRDILYVAASDLTVGDSGGATDSGSVTIATGSDVSLARLTVYGPTNGTTSSLTISGTGSLAGVPFTLQAGRYIATALSSVTGNVIIAGGTLVLFADMYFSTFDVDSGATLDFNGSARAFNIYNRWNLQAGSAWAGAAGVSLTLNNADFTDLVGHTYTSATFNRGSGVPAYVTGSNTFTTLTLNFYGMRVRGGDTITVGTLNTSGASSGAVISTIPAAGTTQFNLSKSSGSVTVSKMIISNCNFTGGATWTADSTSIDAGNNTGITFANNPSFLAFLM